ncbi:MAG: 2Fe-2S iron-sulfur cluster-binding protein, partial [Myxococcota bacterium]|nr:2Fe-2S iron-sulfur cluster-binding protein [Myxococcota bacterium]
MTGKTDRVRVLFTPSGKRGEFARGTNLLAAARELGVDLDSVCGARGICGRCKIRLHEGEAAAQGLVSAPDHLSPLSEPEQRYALRRPLAEDQRLSCHATLEGDCIVDVPPESQLHRQVVRKAFESHDLELDPVLRLHYVEVEPPSLAEPSGDQERLLAALESEWSLTGLSLDPLLLPALQSCLREEEFRVTAGVRDGREVVALWPGLHERVLGVAVDVGSTTIAAHLCDLASGE